MKATMKVTPVARNQKLFRNPVSTGLTRLEMPRSSPITIVMIPKKILATAALKLMRRTVQVKNNYEFRHSARTFLASIEFGKETTVNSYRVQ